MSDSKPKSSQRCDAKASISLNDSVSRRTSRRSRAVSLPLACCASILSAPPPSIESFGEGCYFLSYGGAGRGAGGVAAQELGGCSAHFGATVQGCVLAQSLAPHKGLSIARTPHKIGCIPIVWLACHGLASILQY